MALFHASIIGQFEKLTTDVKNLSFEQLSKFQFDTFVFGICQTFLTKFLSSVKSSFWTPVTILKYFFSYVKDVRNSVLTTVNQQLKIFWHLSKYSDTCVRSRQTKHFWQLLICVWHVIIRFDNYGST